MAIEETPAGLYELMGHWASPEVHETIADVINERAVQDIRFGEQNHPLVTANDGWTTAEGKRAEFKTWAEYYKGANDRSVAEGKLDWADVLQEEVYELLSEEDEEKQYVEAIQVAAVALAIAQYLRRKQRSMQ